MDTKFSVAVHTLIMFSESKDKLTSEAIAKSVGTNASYIRKIISLLKKADLLIRHEGSFDYSLGKAKESMTLLDIYRAVNPAQLLYTHQHANKECPVGGHINAALDPIVAQAEEALETNLATQTLNDVIETIQKELQCER
ncbi:Rrf2 family transcriptional regulator [Streptococcus pneumoniae]